AGVEHLVDHVVHALELLLIAVERHDGRAAPPRFVRVAAATAPHVEDAAAVADAQAIEVDGQHVVRATPSRCARAWSSRRMRHCSTVPTAVARQVNMLSARSRPAAPMRARSSGSLSARTSPAASASGSPGGTSKPVSLSRPTTSGTAPPVVATSGTPHAIASTAGSEKPSYKEGTAATCACAYAPTIRSVATPCTNWPAPRSPSASMRAGIELPLRGVPTTT